MQNKNKIIALICATALLGANMTFATESSSAGMPGMETFTKAMQGTSQMMQMSEEMYKKAMETASGMKMPMPAPMPKVNGPSFTSFINTKLSQEENEKIKAIIDSYVSSVKEMMQKGTSSTLTQEEVASMKEKMATLNKDFVEKITPYIDSTKVEEFKKFVENNGDKPFMFVEGKKPEIKPQDKEKNQQIKEKAKEIKKSLLSQKTRDLFNKKLDQIPAEKQLDFYNKLITKIDLLISKSKAEKTKGLLQELKMITQEKINSFSQNQDEQNVLNEVLDDSSSTTTTGSGETK